jgi:hypothetical protein
VALCCEDTNGNCVAKPEFFYSNPAKLEGVFVLQQFEQKENSKESIEMLEFFLSAGIREDE